MLQAWWMYNEHRWTLSGADPGFLRGGASQAEMTNVQS